MIYKVLVCGPLCSAPLRHDHRPGPSPPHPRFATLPADILYTTIKRTVRGGCGFKYIFSAKPTRRGRGRSFVRSFISFIQSFSQRRGCASIPCSLRIAAEDRQKNRSGGGEGRGGVGQRKCRRGGGGCVRVRQLRTMLSKPSQPDPTQRSSLVINHSFLLFIEPAVRNAPLRRCLLLRLCGRHRRDGQCPPQPLPFPR